MDFRIGSGGVMGQNTGRVLVSLVLLLFLGTEARAGLLSGLFGFNGGRGQQHQAPPDPQFNFQNGGPRLGNGQPFSRPEANGAPQIQPKLLSHEYAKTLDDNALAEAPEISVIPMRCLTSGPVQTPYDVTFVFKRTQQPNGAETVTMKTVNELPDELNARNLRQMMQQGGSALQQESSIPAWAESSNVVYPTAPQVSYNFSFTVFTANNNNPNDWIQALISSVDHGDPRPNKTLDQCAGPVRE